MAETHQFDNGVKVYDHHVTPRQKKRYSQINIHEPAEEKLFVKIIESLGKGECFVSVGSAIGYYPILAKKISPETPVYAFDPLKIHLERFHENILLNGFDTEDFCIQNKAVSAEDGFSAFLEQTFGSVVVGSSPLSNIKTRLKIIVKRILTVLKIKKFQVGYSRVETISLNSLNKIIKHPIGLLQMDIQGVEAEVLNGGDEALASHFIKKFLIGTHGAKIHEQCINALKRHDYIIEIEENEVMNQPDGIIVASAP